MWQGYLKIVILVDIRGSVGPLNKVTRERVGALENLKKHDVSH